MCFVNHFERVATAMATATTSVEGKLRVAVYARSSAARDHRAPTTLGARSPRRGGCYAGLLRHVTVLTALVLLLTSQANATGAGTSSTGAGAAATLERPRATQRRPPSSGGATPPFQSTWLRSDASMVNLTVVPAEPVRAKANPVPHAHTPARTQKCASPPCTTTARCHHHVRSYHHHHRQQVRHFSHGCCVTATHTNTTSSSHKKTPNTTTLYHRATITTVPLTITTTTAGPPPSGDRQQHGVAMDVPT
jgi:hypothetical protein